MNWLKARHFVSLVFLLVACDPQPFSTVMEAQPTLKDEFEGFIQGMDIQAGSGKDPNVCLVKKDGQLVCYSTGQHHPSYASLRTLGPLSDINGSCAVTRAGSLACTLGAEGKPRALPLPEQIIGRINFARDTELCALIINQQGNYAKCYDATQNFIVALTGTMSVTNPDGTTVNRLDHVVSLDQTLENGNGDRLVCGLYTSGKRWCYNATSRTDMPVASAVPARSLALNQTLRCTASFAGQLACEKLKGGPVSLPPILRTTNVVEVTGKDQRMCARYADGDFACWEGMQVYNRRRFNTFQKAVKVQPSQYGICAVFADDKTRCLEPGSGSLVAYQELRADALIASNDQTCSTTADGKINCWGRTRSYDVPKNIPYPTGQEVAVGADHLCYTDDGTVHCQGSNEAGQLQIPADLANHYVTQIVASNQHTCALTIEQKASCWGTNAAGAGAVPADLGPVKSLTTGQSMTCAIGTDNSLRCWGSSFLVADSKKVKKVTEVAIGNTHFCVLNEEQQPTCYGSSGEGKTIPYPSPNGFVSLKAGANHTCAIDAKSKAPYCWGSNSEGQTEIPETLEKARKLALGDNHSCATDDKDRVVCWGNDQASDIEGRFEVTSPGVRQTYRGGLFRHVPFRKTFALCEGGQCSLPQGPVVSFKGLSLTAAPKSESYAFWIDYETSCPVALEWVINGNSRPDITVDRNNAPLTNPNELRRKAMFYKPLNPIREFSIVENGALAGPALVQVRVRAPDGRLVRQLPADCNVQINSVAVIPSETATSLWAQAVVNPEYGFVKRLSESLSLLTSYKEIEESQIINPRLSAITLHEQLKGDLLRGVKNAIGGAINNGGAEYLSPMTKDSTTEDIAKEIMTRLDLDLSDKEGQTDPYITVELKESPLWYIMLSDFIDPVRQETLDNNVMAYNLSIGLLKASTSADTDGRIRRLARRIARGPVENQMKLAGRFLKETGVIRDLLQDNFRLGMEALQSTLTDNPDYKKADGVLKNF